VQPLESESLAQLTPGMPAAQQILESLMADIFSDVDWLLWIREHLPMESTPIAAEFYNPRARTCQETQDRHSSKTPRTSAWQHHHDGNEQQESDYLGAIGTQLTIHPSEPVNFGNGCGPEGHAVIRDAFSVVQDHNKHTPVSCQENASKATTASGHGLGVANGDRQTGLTGDFDFDSTSINTAADLRRLVEAHKNAHHQADDLGIPHAKEAWLQQSMRVPHVTVFAEFALQTFIYSVVQEWVEEGWNLTAADLEI
jgi:hypothetical protein